MLNFILSNISKIYANESKILGNINETKEIMKEPMCDAEGNTYERKAILKYLETHNKSPITGNALSPIDLFPNTALAEKIRLALETFLDSLRE